MQWPTNGGEPKNMKRQTKLAIASLTIAGLLLASWPIILAKTITNHLEDRADTPDDLRERGAI